MLFSKSTLKCFQIVKLQQTNVNEKCMNFDIPKPEIEIVNKYCACAEWSSTRGGRIQTQFHASWLHWMTAWLQKHVQLQIVVWDISLTSGLELSRKKATLVQKSLETIPTGTKTLSMDLNGTNPSLPTESTENIWPLRMKMKTKVRFDHQNTADIRKILCMEGANCMSGLVKSFILVTQAIC